MGLQTTATWLQLCYWTKWNRGRPLDLIPKQKPLVRLTMHGKLLLKKKKRGENITEGDWMSLGTPTVGKSFSGLRSGSAGSFLVSSLLLISAAQAQLLHWCSSQPFLLEARLPLYLSLVLERRKKEVRLYPSTSFPISLFLCKWGLQYKYIFVYQNTHMHTTAR